MRYLFHHSPHSADRPLFFFMLISLLMLMTACSPPSSPHSPSSVLPSSPFSQTSALPKLKTSSTPEKISDSSPPTISPAPAPKHPIAYHHTSRNGITLSLVSFDDRDYQLQVADQSHGPATQWTSAESAAKSLGGVAAINGGFFTPEGKPLGLVITNGQRRGALNRSSLGAGIILTTPTQSAIIRRQHYTQSPQQWGNIQHLLQTGPMLTEHGSPISQLSKKSRRPRSFVAWDGKHHWAIGFANSCTLDALSRAISGHSPAEFSIQTAVNLDGGRSSDFWVSSQIAGSSKTHQSFLNKPVRNFLVITPKP